MWSEDINDREFVGGGLITPQQAYIKEYGRNNMRERIVVEFHSERDGLDLMQKLVELGYKPVNGTVKVCGMGICGQARIYGKK